MVTTNRIGELANDNPKDFRVKDQGTVEHAPHEKAAVSASVTCSSRTIGVKSWGGQVGSSIASPVCSMYTSPSAQLNGGSHGGTAVSAEEQPWLQQ